MWTIRLTCRDSGPFKSMKAAIRTSIIGGRRGTGSDIRTRLSTSSRDFFQAIVNDTRPEPGFEVGLENQKVLEAVTRSIADERWVAVS